MKKLVFLSVILYLTGCSTIRLGGAEFVKRYDTEGNEVAYIIEVNRPAGVDAKDVKTGVRRAGVPAAQVFGTTGYIVGALVGGLIGAATSAVSNDGKIRVKYTDYMMGYERNTRSMMPLEQIDRKAWINSGLLKSGTWARIERRNGDVYLMPCDPACPAVPDKSGLFPLESGRTPPIKEPAGAAVIEEAGAKEVANPEPANEQKAS